jgi:hypothetical protein
MKVILMMDRKTNQEKWTQIIEQQRESPQSQTQWCQEHQVKIHSFCYWVKRLKEIQHESSNGEVSWVSLKKKQPKGLKNSPIRIMIGHATIEIDELFDENMLTKIVGILLSHV